MKIFVTSLAAVFFSQWAGASGDRGDWPAFAIAVTFAFIFALATALEIAKDRP